MKILLMKRYAKNGTKQLLKNFESSFSIHYQYIGDQLRSTAQSLARKNLEAFLMGQTPNGRKTHERTTENKNSRKSISESIAVQLKGTK